MRNLRRVIATIAAALGLVLAPAPVSAHNGNYRGQTCYSGACGPVYAWSYATPTYGHMHAWGQCMTVRIDKDFGDYVSVSKAGYWRSC